jgi:ribonucleotide reductase beta subunit family protein with ferritin-like domain
VVSAAGARVEKEIGMAVGQQAGRSSAVEALSYTDLYRRWERHGQWRATEIDFTADREGWGRLSEIQRKSAVWLYSMFLAGEDSVAVSLAPYIDAAPTLEQKYFLTTQQVDEARHAVFFHRFFTDVIGSTGAIAETVAASRVDQSWGYRRVFERLDRMAGELRRDRSLPKFAQAIALYHMVVEATLAQPGQHFIEAHFAASGEMPGFMEGITMVSLDEQRHIGFGVKTLADCFAQSDECKWAVAELMAEVLRYVAGVFVPPNWDRSYTQCYGFELEDIYAFGISSIRTKWRAAGFPVEEMPRGVFPVDFSLGDEEIARRVILLTAAGVLGEPNQPLDITPEVQALFFDTVAESVDPARAGPRPLCIQWRFSDALPWHVLVDATTARPVQGEAPAPDVTIEASWKDWIDLAARGLTPVGPVLGRRFKIHGSPRALLRLPRLVRYRPKIT